MPKNKMSDLRNHLFETIEMLKEGDLEVNKAKAINEVAQTIVQSAKVEVDALKVIGGDSSEFLGLEDPMEAKFLPRHREFEQ